MPVHVKSAVLGALLVSALVAADAESGLAAPPGGRWWCCVVRGEACVPLNMNACADAAQNLGREVHLWDSPTTCNDFCGAQPPPRRVAAPRSDDAGTAPAATPPPRTADRQQRSRRAAEPPQQETRGAESEGAESSCSQWKTVQWIRKIVCRVTRGEFRADRSCGRCMRS